MAELTIVTVSYNTRAELVACLASLVQTSPTIDHKVVVVDNGSEDGSVEAIREQFPNVVILENATNIGYARANNMAIRATEGDLLLLLNSDTIVPPGAVDGLVARLREWSDVAVVGPRLTDADGRPEISFGRMMSPINELMQMAKGLALQTNIPFFSNWVRRSLERPCLPDWVSGACLLVRRAEAKAVDLLDERFFLYLEDVDFCASIRRRGGRVRFVPDVTFIHHRGRSGSRVQNDTRQRYRRSHLAFYEKHHPAWVPLLRLYLRLQRERPPVL